MRTQSYPYTEAKIAIRVSTATDMDDSEDFEYARSGYVDDSDEDVGEV